MLLPKKLTLGFHFIFQSSNMIINGNRMKSILTRDKEELSILLLYPGNFKS